MRSQRIGAKGRATATPNDVLQSSVYVYAVAGTLIFTVVLLALGHRIAALQNIGFSIVYGLCYFGAKRGKMMAARISSMLALYGQACLGTINHGWDSGVHYYVLAVVPLVLAGTSMSIRRRGVLSATALAVYIAFRILFHGRQALYPMSDAVRDAFGETNLLLAFGVVSFSLFRFSNAYSIAERRLEAANGTILEIANTDDLTGVANRRSIQQILDRAVKDAAAPGGALPLSVALADLDDFKRINDSHGHDGGDAVLREVCARFKRNLRKSDSFGRWGGEEFLFVLENSDVKQAKDAMERLRRAVHDEPIRCGGAAVDVSITVGISAYRPLLDADSLVSEADQLLYIGKRAGKDRVVVENDPAPEVVEGPPEQRPQP